ncbi:MAG TPA: sulfatase-like hydrolase/transferase [Polyangiales bacterium]|nr:sulfatase-like hydrolase/transferase [Polyangiales bacterium]
MPSLFSLSVPSTALRAGLRRAAPALPDGLTAALVSVWSCVGAFGCALKAERVWMHPQRLSRVEQLLLLLPELGFAAGMACASLLLAIGFTRLRAAGVWLRCVQLSGAACAVLATLAHGYFLASGQPLDYGMFAFSLERAGERFGVVASEAHLGMLGALLFTLALLASVPSVLWRRGRTRRASQMAASVSFSWLSLCWLLGCAALCFTLTGYSPARRVERSFARDPVSTLAIGMLRSQLPDTRYRGQPSRPRKTGAAALHARPDAQQRNVVVIILESTRADAVTPYAPGLRTTPFLERFARESILVERAYTVVPHTTKALVTILCGFEPEVTLTNIEARPGGLPGRCLPTLLGARGYDTAFFQAPTGAFEDRRMLAENLGFATFVSGDRAPHAGFERINYFGYEDAIMLGPSESWLKARGGRPFLAAYLTSAAHHPYGVPKSHPTQQFAKGDTKDKYLNAIHYTDGVIERLLEQYRRLGLLENSVFVVVGDHGEAFGEHGLYTHDDVLFEEGLRVPLLVRLPGAERAGQRIPGPISELAIVPSLIALAGFQARDQDYEHGSLLERPAASALYAHCYRGDRCAAVIRDPYKLIDHFDERPAELFDLKLDPREENDLADDQPELVERWTRELADVRLAVHASYRNAAARALDNYISEDPPDIPHPRPAQFGDYLRFLGLRLPPPEQLREFGKPGSSRFLMSYYFHVMRKIPPGFSLRVHMRGDRGSISDLHKPLRGLLLLEDFPVGQYVEDFHRVALPDGWQSPTLTLCLALFDERERPVPVSQPGKAAEACLPVLTLDIASYGSVRAAMPASRNALKSRSPSSANAGSSAASMHGSGLASPAPFGSQ